MSPSFTPELGKLLLPISVADPGGEWLRYSELYDRIQEARRSDDPTLPRGIWDREMKKADWELTAKLCEEAIEHRSKDLYVVIWLMEAWIHRHGIAGAAAGLQLLHGLCRDLWETLYPRIDPDDPDVRSAPFEWLNDKIPITLGIVIVTHPESLDSVPATWLEVVTARAGEVGRKEARAKSEMSEGASDSVRVMTSVALTQASWYRDLEEQTDAALEAAEELKALLQVLAPDSPPSLGRIEEVLRDMKRWFHNILEERPVKVAVPVPAIAAPSKAHPSPPKGGIAMPLAHDGVVRNREEAYHLLSIAAEYLLRTEPHSPTPYLVQRAVNWGNMPLSELLEEFSQDGNDLRMLRVLLGVGEGPEGP